MKHLLRLLFVVLITTAGLAPQHSYGQARDTRAGVAAPDAYVLTAAYPNPFNPTTTFSLTVRQRQNVRIHVFNMLGQPVKEVFSGPMNGGETRTFTFDAGDLPSGIYIYRVQGEAFTASRQMMLVK